MFSRRANYEASAESDKLGDMSNKLAVDLRKHIRLLDSHKIFTREWLAMTDALAHISNIAKMEHRLPRPEKDSTLWEGDDLTIRFMLEEGKLNLCLRLMHEYCRAMIGLKSANDGYRSWLVSTASSCGVAGPEQLAQRLLTFEQSLGVLLRCALEHIEAVQTTDLPELMTHIAEVLAFAVSAPAESLCFERTQEAMVGRYLHSVMARVEALDEDRLMPMVLEHDLVNLVVAHLGAHAVALEPEGQLAAASFLALALDTEAFETTPGQFLSPSSKEVLKTFTVLFLGELSAEVEQRRKLRPLLDAVARASR